MSDEPPRGRIRLGHLMFLVVLTGVGIVYVRMYQYARFFGRRVLYHDTKRAQIEGMGRFTWEGGRWVEGVGITPRPALAAYHARMSAMYQDAARHPWRSIAPDPPEPE